MNNTNNVIYNILEWINRFAYINLLWILFTILGAGILGFYPSTTAMFSIVRTWLQGNKDVPVFKTFSNYFKRDFFKSNLLGLFITFIIVLLAIDIFYIQVNIDQQLTWTYIPLFAFMLFFILFLFYIFPTFVHYDVKLTQIIKNAFLIMLISPIQSFFIILSLGSIYFVMRALPALFFIFGGSTYAFITMWLAMHTFNRVAKKQQG
ncbi:YesL family protein [Aquibacillus sediminis]|uniref:YesL family protein n=1 Tax=Aquibacillus sediminis TaxID=2574734 RepID=UPI00110844EB|nr:DUF624 domain-containing protein [Aquibacillus sediminis]